MFDLIDSGKHFDLRVTEPRENGVNQLSRCERSTLQHGYFGAGSWAFEKKRLDLPKCFHEISDLVQDIKDGKNPNFDDPMKIYFAVKDVLLFSENFPKQFGLTNKEEFYLKEIFRLLIKNFGVEVSVKNYGKDSIENVKEKRIEFPEAPEAQKIREEQERQAKILECQKALDEKWAHSFLDEKGHAFDADLQASINAYKRVRAIRGQPNGNKNEDLLAAKKALVEANESFPLIEIKKEAAICWLGYSMNVGAVAYQTRKADIPHFDPNSRHAGDDGFVYTSTSETNFRYVVLKKDAALLPKEYVIGPYDPKGADFRVDNDWFWYNIDWGHLKKPEIRESVKAKVSPLDDHRWKEWVAEQKEPLEALITANVLMEGVCTGRRSSYSYSPKEYTPVPERNVIKPPDPGFHSPPITTGWAYLKKIPTPFFDSISEKSKGYVYEHRVYVYVPGTHTVTAHSKNVDGTDKVVTLKTDDVLVAEHLGEFNPINLLSSKPKNGEFDATILEGTCLLHPCVTRRGVARKLEVHFELIEGSYKPQEEITKNLATLRHWKEKPVQANA